MRGPEGWHYRFETDTQGGLRKTLARIAPDVSVGPSLAQREAEAAPDDLGLYPERVTRMAMLTLSNA